MVTEPDTELANLKSQAFKSAQEAMGTAYIFEVRARWFRRQLNLLAFAGLALPLVIGGIALGYGAKSSVLTVLIPVATVLGIFQLVASLWSLVGQWVSNYDSAARAIVSNRLLSQQFESLGRSSSLTAKEFRQQLEVLNATDKAQRQSDYLQEVTDTEKRMGMRAVLVQYQKECRKCKKIPSNMTPTECGVCGDYPGWRLR